MLSRQTGLLGRLWELPGFYYYAPWTCKQPPGNVLLLNYNKVTVFHSHLRNSVALVCQENTPNLNFSF